jgi:hypothetical protein
MIRPREHAQRIARPAGAGDLLKRAVALLELANAP